MFVQFRTHQVVYIILYILISAVTNWAIDEKYIKQQYVNYESFIYFITTPHCRLFLDRWIGGFVIAYYLKKLSLHNIVSDIAFSSKNWNELENMLYGMSRALEIFYGLKNKKDKPEEVKCNRNSSSNDTNLQTENRKMQEVTKFCYL